MIKENDSVNLETSRIYYGESKGALNFSCEAVLDYVRDHYGDALANQIDEDCTQARRITYDARRLVTRRTGLNGSVTDYRYNARGLKTARTEAAGMPAARSRVTEWHPRLRLPVKITVEGKKTVLGYDSAGRLLRRVEIDTATFQTRVTRYRYYSAADFGGALHDSQRCNRCQL